MKQIIGSLIVVLVVLGCSNSTKEKESEQIIAPLEAGTRIIGEQADPDTLKGSLKARAMGTIGEAGITVNYYSPAVRGRIIWGGLVPFDNVWVTGAHKATSIEINQEVVIGDVTVAPGKYALFTIPGKTQWTFIINRNWEQHLADDYNAMDDVVRVSVEPEMEDTNQERLRYVIEEDELVVYWEKLEVSLPIKSKNQ